MEDYIKLCKTSELKNKFGKKFTLEDGNEIAVFKVGVSFHAFSNTCPHNHTPSMSEGIIENGTYVICPIHCYKFNIETGKTPPEQKDMSGRLEIFRTMVIDDELWVEKKKKNLFKWL